MKKIILFAILVIFIKTEVTKLTVFRVSDTSLLTVLRRSDAEISFNTHGDHFVLQGICNICKVALSSKNTFCKKSVNSCSETSKYLEKFILNVLTPNLMKVMKSSRSTTTIYGNGKWIKLKKIVE